MPALSGKRIIAGERRRITGHQPAHRAILLTTVLHRVLHEAGVDRDGIARGQTCGKKSPGARAGNVGADRGAEL